MDNWAIDSAETTEVDDSISWDSETDMVWGSYCRSYQIFFAKEGETLCL